MPQIVTNPSDFFQNTLNFKTYNQYCLIVRMLELMGYTLVIKP